MDSELEALFSTAVAGVRAKQKAERAAVIRHTSEPQARATQQLFLDPDNWERKRGIALVHEETSTVLGNFSEYVHKSVPGCRRLLREEQPISVSATERVEGSWWLQDRKPEPPRPWHEKRTAFIHLHLSKLGVHAPACEVVACLAYGSLDRVELAVDCQFAQEEGRGAELLFLAAGTNVLPVMSSDCKIKLLQEVGRPW